MTKRRRERENVHPPPNCMSRMGVAATVRVEVHVGSLSPSGHASGNPLPGQWAIPFITWEEPVLWTATAQRLKQLQRGAADADGAGLAALAEKVNLASAIERLNVLPLQAAQLGNPAAQEIAALHHHEVTAGCGAGGGSSGDGGQNHAEIVLRHRLGQLRDYICGAARHRISGDAGHC